MKPNPGKAKAVLEEIAAVWWEKETHKTDVILAAAKALGFLRGYELPPEVLSRYRCSFCGAAGVKLWRAAHSAREAWCSRCGTAQAGLPDNADENGRMPTRYSGHIDGKTDQIYSAKQGACLLPWVPTPDGQTWGYTSVPPEGCAWWRSLPTRPKE